MLYAKASGQCQRLQQDARQTGRIGLGEAVGRVMRLLLPCKRDGKHRRLNKRQLGSYYNPRMRSWLVVVLMVLLPLQLSWAATGQYCQHEVDTSAKHLGHHVHQHRNVEQNDSSADQAKAVATDADCGTCHSGCSMAIQHPESICNAPASLAFASGPRAQPTHAPVDPPYRPQWRTLA